MKVIECKSLVVLIAALSFSFYSAGKEPSAAVDGAVVIEEGVAGGIVVDTLEIQAKVTAIDHKTREVSLLLPGGTVETIKVGDGAVNFNQVAKGDLVDVVVSEELVVYMGAEDAELDDGEEMVILAAAPGAEPGVIAADTIRTTAMVVALDGLSRTATLAFEDGTVRTVAVRDDIDLTKHRLGEKIVFESTKMFAISIQKK